MKTYVVRDNIVVIQLRNLKEAMLLESIVRGESLPNSAMRIRIQKSIAIAIEAHQIDDAKLEQLVAVSD